MKTNNEDSKKRVTITATDRIGRTESITMILSAKTADRLQKASQEPDDLGELNDYRLLCALNDLYDSYKEWRNYPSSVKGRYKTEISKTQFYRLSDFYSLTYHKFYKYTLSITIK